MIRVAVVGSGGAGKSTFARHLGERLGGPVIHLDGHCWQPGWVATPSDEWRARQRDLIAGEHGSSTATAAQPWICASSVVTPSSSLLCRGGAVYVGCSAVGSSTTDETSRRPDAPSVWSSRSCGGSGTTRPRLKGEDSPPRFVTGSPRPAELTVDHHIASTPEGAAPRNHGRLPLWVGPLERRHVSCSGMGAKDPAGRRGCVPDP